MIHWQTDSAALGPQAQSAFASLDSTFALEGEVLANSRVSRVIRVELDGSLRQALPGRDQERLARASGYHAH